MARKPLWSSLLSSSLESRSLLSVLCMAQNACPSRALLCCHASCVHALRVLRSCLARQLLQP
jgi:hypothetical protein